ncbi:uncharacterized protein LOC118756257 [Rhagoletis pomonella]|uniref:uncharacterized protein LOC118756257 n=1 Tax=Rhagoletis pomonella TaxID=28610 RepID=UPI001783A7F0|nr:uncharacterized protein LOC118756257 [Rhagoletis pomonella]
MMRSTPLTSADPGSSTHLMTSLPITTNMTVRAPPFSTERPALWFAQLESQFRNRSVSNENDMFHHAVSLIDTQSAAEVEAIILNPSTPTPYTLLKQTLIERLTKSKDAKLLHLLNDEEIGERTPSQFFRHLRSLCPDVPNNVIKARWQSQLSPQTRACLAAQPDASSEDLSRLADKIHEVIPSESQSISTVSADQSLLGEIAEICKQIQALNMRNSRSRTRQKSLQ